jgi:hypothetical protein
VEALSNLRTLDQALADLVERRGCALRTEYRELLDQMIAGLKAEIGARHYPFSPLIEPALVC